VFDRALFTQKPKKKKGKEMRRVLGPEYDCSNTWKLEIGSFIT
jgi:hypothetical protein